MCLLGLIAACGTYRENWKKQLHYLRLTELTVTHSLQQHIELRDSHKVKYADDEFFLQDDREIMERLGYSERQKTAVIKEYLLFQGCRSKSNKQYAFHIGTTENRLMRAHDSITFSVEVEALYSLSILLLKHNVRISPVLINKTTGRVCNYNRMEMDEIYSLYRKWFVIFEQNKFKRFVWPLKNSNYGWLGESDAPLELVSTL
ncbi:hypothetical protein BDE36_2611 [Arcticibacter tournemirensis]|nr:hypothetical protein BDE36_2611 [Arcticibacter tournemirensis]